MDIAFAGGVALALLAASGPRLPRVRDAKWYAVVLDLAGRALIFAAFATLPRIAAIFLVGYLVAAVYAVLAGLAWKWRVFGIAATAVSVTPVVAMLLAPVPPAVVLVVAAVGIALAGAADLLRAATACAADWAGGNSALSDLLRSAACVFGLGALYMVDTHQLVLLALGVDALTAAVGVAVYIGISDSVRPAVEIQVDMDDTELQNLPLIETESSDGVERDELADLVAVAGNTNENEREI